MEEGKSRVIVVEARDQWSSDLAHLAYSWADAVAWISRHDDYAKDSGTWWWVAYETKVGDEEHPVRSLRFFDPHGVPIAEQPFIPSRAMAIREAVNEGLSLYFKAKTE